jgi:hypothetical protein
MAAAIARALDDCRAGQAGVRPAPGARLLPTARIHPGMLCHSARRSRVAALVGGQLPSECTRLANLTNTVPQLPTRVPSREDCSGRTLRGCSPDQGPSRAAKGFRAQGLPQRAQVVLRRGGAERCGDEALGVAHALAELIDAPAGFDPHRMATTSASGPRRSFSSRTARRFASSSVIGASSRSSITGGGDRRRRSGSGRLADGSRGVHGAATELPAISGPVLRFRADRRWRRFRRGVRTSKDRRRSACRPS